ncbi:hypothetical protein BG011_003225 [Mortierella polycephala]|uniref:Uncharacterized protein n=1 Tax=Mortierella polycephala TaxID=41804 RepID=A0A9P6Q1K9_9FUNG|nr:hypothetical protein BG011_003225 [Mortierella polycephala]
MPKCPQDRSYAWADVESNKFYVKTSYYEFSSYKDLSAFLRVYNNILDKDKCFNGQIREGHACSEYYDIDWHLSIREDNAGPIVQLEQRVFEEFLAARSQYAPEYPVSGDQCRTINSSSSSKLPLHVVKTAYSFDNNNKHMLVFMQAMQGFKGARSMQDQDKDSLGDHIGMGAYSKNRVSEAASATIHLENFSSKSNAYLRLGTTGKTVLVEQLVKANNRFKFIAVICRRTPAAMLGERLRFSKYQDIRTGLIACDTVVIQAESLCEQMTSLMMRCNF